MSTNNNVVRTSSLSIHKFEGKPSIIISKNLQNIVTFLHNKIGSDEWSGPLFYEILEGDIKDPNSVVIKAHHVHLQDIGTGTYTEYNQNAADFMTVLEDYPDLMDGLMEGRIKIGHLHTHHNMAAFFSGTDDSELHDNSKNYNMYLSLIVNFACKPVAKIGIKGKRKIVYTSAEDTFNFLGQEGTEDSIEFSTNNTNKEYECIVEVECDVKYEVDEQVSNQYNLIKDKRKVPAYNAYAGGHSQGGYGRPYYENHANFPNPHANSQNIPNQNQQNQRTNIKTREDEWGILNDTLVGLIMVRLITSNNTATETLYSTLIAKHNNYLLQSVPERTKENSRIFNEFEKYIRSNIANNTHITNDVLREAARSMVFWCKTYKSVPYSDVIKPLFDNLVEKYDKLVKDDIKKNAHKFDSNLKKVENTPTINEIIEKGFEDNAQQLGHGLYN